MKVYLLKDSDFEKLEALMKLSEAEQLQGISPEDSIAIAQVKRAYHYRIVSWIQEMKDPKA